MNADEQVCPFCGFESVVTFERGWPGIPPRHDKHCLRCDATWDGDAYRRGRRRRPPHRAQG